MRLAVDAVVSTFALIVCVGMSVVCGLLPAWRVRKLNLVEAMVEDGTAPVGADPGSRAARSLVVDGESGFLVPATDVDSPRRHREPGPPELGPEPSVRSGPFR